MLAVISAVVGVIMLIGGTNAVVNTPPDQPNKAPTEHVDHFIHKKLN